MKFKMAPNSLFAVLLRSPWWISIGLVALVALAAAALLPAQYVAFGVMGGFPFLVIGLIAAQRQWHAPSTEQTTKVLEKLGAMGWREFSQLLARAYERQGYQVSTFAGAAADLLLTRDGRTTLVACKRWKASIHGSEPLRNLARARQQHDASLAIYVSIHAVNDATRRAVREHPIGLTDGVELVALVRKDAVFV
ncbi:MAG: restriction endonuclease [Rhodoferax sp.]|nr:restriction endonuclease [Rhodoferax sp.]